ncbi:Prolyl 4-hydroxylase, alpha subunit, partial [Metarhizium majus ARSEF 297]
MTQSKSAKRKRKAQAQLPKKHVKTTTIVTPPPDSDATQFEPKNLQTVISDEELDITIETLTTLAQYPSLTKSKLCKNLRTAVYDFRQSCTTGVNSAEGANLTGRVTAALADEKYLEAKILLAEMRLRGEEPKLGALCRWVRDLDVVTQPKGASIVNPNRSDKERELLQVLDAVMRVSCPIDTNPEAKSPSQLSSHIALQPTWDLRPCTEPHQVYASVLDKSILASGPDSLSSSLRIIETTPGHLRKPPNHHPAILYTTEPNAVDLSSEHSGITYHEHPSVPHLGLATGVLSPEECKAIIATGESVGFLPDIPVREGEDTSVLAHNFYWVVDTAFHDKLWARMAPFVSASLNGRRSRGVNRRFRVYRYVPGAEYRCHIDGAWPPSGIRPDDTYVYDDSPAEKKQSSLFTFLLYLNDEFEGGETTFYIPGQREGTLNAYPVRPVMGGVAVFPHGETKGALLHEGTSVRKGAKYIIRTDIEYDVEPSEE